jgi:thiamine-monophosphate kinase
MAEFDLIQRLRQIVTDAPGSQRNAPVIGIGDDAAVLEIPTGRQLVVTTDTLLENTHFFADIAPGDLAHKALAVNLSDLAAMGAEPAWFFLALTLPELRMNWIDQFASSLASLARDSGIVLAGGDTTSGPLSVTITAMGFVVPGQALTRSGAGEGDYVVVSGSLGDAALDLRNWKPGESSGESAAALLRPEPRLSLGESLVG